MDHHAVCYVGFDFGRQELKDQLTDRELDITVEEFVTFGIDDARRLTSRAYLAPVKSPVQVFVLFIQSVTAEAQNALLKLLEEPPDRSVFKLVVPKKGLLLPTLQSRLHIIESDSNYRPEANGTINLGDMPYGERLMLINTITKEKDIEKIEEFVESAEQLAHESKQPESLKAITYVRSQLNRRGSSSKMLLEFLALSLPVS